MSDPRLIDAGRLIARLQLRAALIEATEPRAAADMAEAAHAIGVLSDALDDQSRRDMKVARTAYRVGLALGKGKMQGALR